MATLTDAEWESYKTKYGKSYADATEEAKRRDIVAKRKQVIDEHNKKYAAGEVGFSCGLNDFTDATDEERSRRCGRRAVPKSFGCDQSN